MFAIMEDMKTLKRLLDDEEVEWGCVPAEGDHATRFTPEADIVETALMFGGKVVALDTESSKGAPWSVQFSVEGRVGYIVPADAPEALGAIRDYVARPDVLTVMHNAAYDYGVLGVLGIVPARFTDTMLMANLIQTLPRGLKALAGRHLGLLMNEYDDLVAPYGGELQLAYLNEAASMVWEDEEAITKIVKGERKSRIPTNIVKRIERILKDYHGKGCNLYERWHRIKPEEGRESVEDVLGSMPVGDISLVPHAEAVRYAGTDAVATFRLYPILSNIIHDLELETALDLDLGIVPMLSDMTTNGIALDLTKIGEIDKVLNAELVRIDAEVERIAGHPVNLNSFQQLAQWFYERGIFKTPTHSTRKEMLEPLRDSYPEIDLAMTYKETKKLSSTYVKALPRRIGKDGRMRTSWSQITAITGRLASKEPNLQNIPVRTDVGLTIRKAFVPAPNCSFISGDMSQIEVRVLAVESGDELLTQWFKEDKDVHAYVASEAFGVPVEMVDKRTQRDPTKTTVFGIIYGMSAQRLARKTGWTIPACEDFINRVILGKFPAIKRLIARCQATARSRHAIRDMFGRRRVLAEVSSTQKEIVESGHRMAVNSLIQSGAGGIFKRAMMALTPVYKAWQAEGYIMRPVLQIHDDLVWEVSDEIVETVLPIIQYEMEHCVELPIPIKVGMAVSKSWGGLK
jgi:DNA polymerase I-like protein with 3'-5' exonuclease and polymerase domains